MARDKQRMIAEDILNSSDPRTKLSRRAQMVIDRQVGHLSHLVDDLLDLTRISQNKIRLEPQLLELNDLVRRVVEDHRLLFEKSEIQVEVKLDPERVSVNADGTRLAQVIGNLLQNAAKFTGHGGAPRCLCRSTCRNGKPSSASRILERAYRQS